MPWHEGDLVHKLRRLSKWTVEELATRAKMNPSVIYRLEDGRTKEPKRRTVTKLATVFGLSLREFTDAIPPGSVRLALEEPVVKKPEETARPQTAPRRPGRREGSSVRSPAERTR